MIFESFMTFLGKILFFTSYVNNGNSSFPPPLKPDEEREYMLKAQQGCRASRDILVRHNLRLVAHIVKKYSNAAEADDLISIGSIGLIKAINTYKYGKGTQLATYAAKCIENEILMYIRANKKHKQDVSLMEKVGVDNEGNEITFLDLLAIKGESVYDKVEMEMLCEKLAQFIRENLDEREYEIICLRYGLGTGKCLTQREVARLQNISRSYVSRLEKKALGSIREKIKKSELLY